MSKTLQNFGTAETPYLHNIASQGPLNCFPHLIYSPIKPASLDLGESNQPFLLSSLPSNYKEFLPISFKIKRYPIRSSTKYGSFCRFSIFYIQQIHLVDKERQQLLTDLIQLYAYKYKINFISARLCYVALVLSDQDYQFYFRNRWNPLYSLTQDETEQIPIAYFLAIFISNLKPHSDSVVCSNKYQNSLPILQFMHCVSISCKNKIIDFYQETRLPCYWEILRLSKQEKETMGPMKKLVYLILTTKFNLTSFDCGGTKDVSNDVYSKEFGSITEPTMVFIDSREYNFVTCYSKKELNYLFYQNAFQVEVWIWIVSTAVAFIIVGEILIKMKFEEEPNLRFSFALHIIGSIFEIGVNIESKLRNTNFFRILLFSATTLSNGYKGLHNGPGA